MKLIVTLFFCVLVTPSVTEAQRSLYSDYKATRIGDLITIRLEENISGSSNNNNSNRSGTSGQASGALTGNLAGFLPIFGANANVDYQAEDRKSSGQSQLLRGTVSARIEDILPNGDLYLVGARKSEINGELYQLEIKGFVRPADIDGYNEVSSYRIANAEILYKQNNGLSQAFNKPNVWNRVLWIGLGIGLGTAAVLGVN